MQLYEEMASSFPSAVTCDLVGGINRDNIVSQIGFVFSISVSIALLGAC